ncbi:MAG: hypothetical protein WC848_00585 [Parcubacteria group bacterium]|jgi:hypothetical protein
MSDSLSQNILATICYYDVLDYPLTVFELWKYLISDPAYASSSAKAAVDKNATASKQEKKKILIIDIINELESEALKKQIETFRGYYFLPGRKDLVAQRIERNKISEEKYKIVRRVIKLLRFVPFIRMIAVTGRMAMKNAEEKSDLDLMIILEKGHIFTGRFLTVAFLSVLGIRRHGEKIKNKICLNHFLSTDFSVSIKDLFSAHEYVFMVPIFGLNFYHEFLEKNKWIEEIRPNFSDRLANMKEIRDSQFSKTVRENLEKIFAPRIIENNLREFQTAKIKANPKTKKIGGVIIYADEELAFWPNFEKQGPRVFEEFKARVEKIAEATINY